MSLKIERCYDLLDADGRRVSMTHDHDEAMGEMIKGNIDSFVAYNKLGHYMSVVYFYDQAQLKEDLENGTIKINE